jgi:hypothetical protein
MFTGTGRLETDSQVLVALCDGNVIRIHFLERGYSSPAEERGCARRDMGGWFVLKPVSTIVVDVGGPSPTMLLRQGSYSLAPPRTWSASPTGLVLFGGGSLTGVSRFKDVACGTLTDCSSGGAELGFSVGAAYWITPFLGAEASYLRPKELTANGSGDNFRFDSTFDERRDGRLVVDVRRRARGLVQLELRDLRRAESGRAEGTAGRSQRRGRSRRTLHRGRRRRASQDWRVIALSPAG